MLHMFFYVFTNGISDCFMFISATHFIQEKLGPIVDNQSMFLLCFNQYNYVNVFVDVFFFTRNTIKCI